MVLRAPSANRVYARRSAPLTRREAHWVLGAHLGAGYTVGERSLAGIDYLEVGGGPTDTERMLPLIATLSTTFAAYVPSATEGQQPALRPVALPEVFCHGSELETTLKYRGKTNEQFTAMLLNLAAALSERRQGLLDGSLRVLDPMAGRGSTLNRALRLGLSPLGSEVERKEVEAYTGFVRTWARQERLRHTARTTRLTVNGRHLGSRLDAELARDKAQLRAGRAQQLTVLGCDAAHLPELLPAGSIDAVVADLPYGVQHAARSGQERRRTPLDVLARLAPQWHDLLRSGGGMALAINRHTADPSRLRSILADAGLHVLGADGEFRHRVDQAIDRDVVLAVRTDHPALPHLDSLAAAPADVPSSGTTSPRSKGSTDE